jgi:hypothetical protein
VADGREALSCLSRRSGSIDVLCSEIVMAGGLSGWELAKQAQTAAKFSTPTKTHHARKTLKS